MEKFVLTLTLSLLFGYCAASTIHYQTPLSQSRWNVRGDKTGCRMEHEIPGYGRAVFNQLAGKPLSFILHTKPARVPISKATLKTRVPLWQQAVYLPNTYPVDLESNPSQTDIKRLIVRGEIAELMLNELGRGHLPTFSYVRSYNTEVNNEIMVSVSAVNFFDAYARFKDCRADLLPFGRNDVNNKPLFFGDQSGVLSTRAKDRLDRLVEFFLISDDEEIDIAGDLESYAGESGKKLFETRQQAVQDYLLNKGVLAKHISSQLGDGFPDATKKHIQIPLLGPEGLSAYYFMPLEFSLDEDATRKLDFLASYLQSHFTRGKLIINGYADSRGTREANRVLSLKRATAIKSYLIEKGVLAKRMVLRPHGETRPVHSNRTAQGRAKNRRVNIDFQNKRRTNSQAARGRHRPAS